MIRQLIVTVVSATVLLTGFSVFAAGNAVSGVMSFSSGAKISLGAEVEHELERNFGVGGFFRFFQKDDDTPGLSNGLTAIGGNARIHIPQKRWDFSVAPGFAVLNIDAATGDDSTTLGPALALAIVYQLNANIFFGVEHQAYWAWFDKDFAGKVADDLALKFTGTF